MIKLEHEVLCSNEQMEFIIEGMRNPMNSWEKSDSTWGCYCYDGEMKDCDICNHIAPDDCTWNPDYILGKNDLDLMTRLSKAGKDHRKYMRMIPVMIRVTAPLYWWKEFDTYKISTVANSTSTMHKITAKKFTLNDFSTDMLTDRSLAMLDDVIDLLNFYRGLYLNGGNDGYSDSDDVSYKPKDKRVWYQLIQMLPDSYNQTRNVFFNYEVLANIYQGRRNHKLYEWHVFCDWIEALPYSHLITGKEPNDLKTDIPLTGKACLDVALPANSYVATDPVQWETVESFPKVKLAPSDLKDVPDNIEEQGKLIGEAFNNIVNKAVEYINDEAYRKMKESVDISIAEFLDTKPKDSSVATAMPSDIMCGNTFGKMNDNEHETCSDVIKECENIVLRPNIADMTLSDIYKNFRLHNEDSDNDKPQRNCNC